jgi:hypothetical protein
MDLDYQKRKEYYRAYFKKRAAEDKKKGICLSCRRTSAVHGKTCCQQCLDDKKLTLKFGSAGPYRQLYAELFERQGGRCGICTESMNRPVLDHNHKTMEVRGLLCQKCNIGLGQFKDNPQILKAALTYLENNTGIGISMRKDSK